MRSCQSDLDILICCLSFREQSLSRCSRCWLFSLVTLSLGWCTRISCWLAFAGITYFGMLDCVSTMTKYTAIASHLLFILAISPCGAIWSVDAWLANKKQNLDPTKSSIEYPKFPAWPRRLMQLFIGCVYFGAAMTKIHTPSFFTGDQFQYWMLTHLNYQHPIGEFFSGYPILLVAFAVYVTVVWEITFLVCTPWKSVWRNFVLPVRILFHFID